MLVETITCLSIKIENEKLVLVLSGTNFDDIEAHLIGKKELSIFTDNQGTPELVEKHYDYAKADSCKYDYEAGTYTLTLRKLTQLEKEVEELKAAMAKLLETSPAAE